MKKKLPALLLCMLLYEKYGSRYFFENVPIAASTFSQQGCSALNMRSFSNALYQFSSKFIYTALL